MLAPPVLVADPAGGMTGQPGEWSGPVNTSRSRKVPAMPLPAVLLVICLAIVTAPGGAAQVATPNPAVLPEATAPFGLSAVTLPAPREDMLALLEQLPETLEGERRGPVTEEDGRQRVTWGAEVMPLGHPITLGVLDFPEGDFFPADFTAGDYVGMTLLADDTQVVAADPDGNLVWVRAEIMVGSLLPGEATLEVAGTLHTLAWGEIDSAWLFPAAADTPERLEALVRAFVAAGAAEGATPSA